MKTHMKKSIYKVKHWNREEGGGYFYFFSISWDRSVYFFSFNKSEWLIGRDELIKIDENPLHKNLFVVEFLHEIPSLSFGFFKAA